MSTEYTLCLVFILCPICFIIGYLLGKWKNIKHQIIKFEGNKGVTIPKGTQVMDNYGVTYTTIKKATIK